DLSRKRGKSGAMNNLAGLQALAFEPRKAFTELDARPRFWWPLLLVVLASGAVSAWYTAFVDLEWLTDLQLRSSALTQNMTSAEIERLARNATARQGVSAVFNFIVTTLLVAVVMLIMALYYSLAGKVTNVQRGFRHWLALVSWTSIPTLITLLA